MRREKAKLCKYEAAWRIKWRFSSRVGYNAVTFGTQSVDTGGLGSKTTPIPRPR